MTISDSDANTDAKTKRDPKDFPLDEKFGQLLRSEDLEFIKAQTGIQGDDELKKHVVAIQKEAYSVFPYQCIRFFGFAMSKIQSMPYYGQLVKLGLERKDAILLDVGCCFGSDTRRIAADGWPAQKIITSDVHAEFWDLGHKLFRSSRETFPAIFIAGDAFNASHLEVGPVVNERPDVCPPPLNTLTSLNPLRGHVSAIHAANLFHLFTEEQQARLARALAGLLSAEPGSMIVGEHSSAPDKGVRTAGRGQGTGSIAQFCHTPGSWEELWDGQVFEKGTVKVEASLEKMEWASIVYYFLRWSVTRL